MGFIIIIHSRLSISIVLYVIILFVWGLWLYFRRGNMDGSYMGALVIAEILILTQGALGGILYFNGLLPSRGGMHILYGIVGALSLPAVYTFTKGRNDRMAVLIYTAVLLFSIGIFIRSISTG
jgi:hypothetical protein